jgi:hypothetical protein
MLIRKRLEQQYNNIVNKIGKIIGLYSCRRYIMRQVILLVLMLLIGTSLMGCSEDLQDDKQVFEADVIENGERLLISPDKESQEYSSSDRIAVAVREADIIDSNGKSTKLDMIKPGDRIKVYYNGLIAESYPAQITADRIELLGPNKVISGFLALIDDIYQEDSALNSNITMIAFDTSGWTMLSEIETEIILNIVEKEYSLDVVVGTYDELVIQGLIDKDNLYFENGILIEIGDIDINNDKDTINCSMRKWRSGKGAIGWNAEASLKNDTWEIERNNRWIS